MEAAMQDAANEQGIGRHELHTFMNHLAAQSTSAAQTLQRQLNETSQAQQRAMAEQGSAFAQALAEQSQAADRRDRAQQLAMEALRQTPQTAPSVAPPVTPAQQVIHNYHTNTRAATSGERWRGAEAATRC